MQSKIINNFRRDLNRLTFARVPYILIIDFEQKKPLLYPLSSLPPDIYYNTPLGCGGSTGSSVSVQSDIRRSPVDYNTYLKAFNNVRENIGHGNSYLLNLTFPTPIETELSLLDIYSVSKARYKLLIDNEFVVFSPETFVTIRDNVISSFPMKGTIDASIDNALETIMNDEKELSEHNTIVDLIRNDLSIVANNIEVKRYRYNELIKAGEKALIQISSEIKGNLNDGWQEKFGDILLSMLPAGSISGAPKEETLRIIKESEVDERGYYTGIFGLFDGQSFDSAVMIRYIEQKEGRYVYRSGGGITWLSDPQKEYDELIAKVYVPFA